MGQINQDYRLKYWATRSSVRSFARTAHSFACSALLALLAHFAYSLACGKVNDLMAIFSVFFSILAHSGLPTPKPGCRGAGRWFDAINFALKKGKKQKGQPSLPKRIFVIWFDLFRPSLKRFWGLNKRRPGVFSCRTLAIYRSRILGCVSIMIFTTKIWQV